MRKQPQLKPSGTYKPSPGPAPPRKRAKHNTAFNRRCFHCGGMVVQDGELWECVNPECERVYIEVHDVKAFKAALVHSQAH